MIKKILIANRGEIACRIIKTAKKMQLKTVAVFSPIDKHALFVEEADEAIALGGSLPQENYLNIEKLIAAAQKTGANCIHPGYGFLSENANFAKACLDAGLIFCGPPLLAIANMGDKEQAKSHAKKAGIPLLPSYYNTDTSPASWETAAKKIGYPILIKPVAGGGGKGMHIVQDPKTLTSALESARREALSAFGDERLMLEKFLIGPRHIEVQIFADNFGNVIHLFERDCSVQRRHQKIIESAPALIEKTLRQALVNAAVTFAKAIHYAGAGTIEFLVDEQSKFYFMEMNTRLQVEHPITEMITQLDLVEWQIRIAAGEPLPLTQSEITQNGHAIEARVYAESPENNFLPSSGKINHLRSMPESEHLRLDSGIKNQDTIPIYYDPLLAKVIAHAPTAKDATQLLKSALAHFEILGVETNLSFLQKTLNESEYQAGKIHTRWVDENIERLIKPSFDQSYFVIFATLAHVLKSRKNTKTPHNTAEAWDVLTGWTQLGKPRKQFLRLQEKNETYLIEISFLPDHCYRFSLNGTHWLIRGEYTQNQYLKIRIDNHLFNVITLEVEKHWYVAFEGEQHVFEIDKVDSGFESEDNHSRILAPLSARVVAVLASPGQKVKRGEKLILLEAMKMEHALSSPIEASIKAIYTQPGNLVDEGMVLIEFE